MSRVEEPRPTSTARILTIVTTTGVILGILAQFLRQLSEPAMTLGAATAPWLTIGFALAVWTTRGKRGPVAVSGHGVMTIALYLLAWLSTYHATFAIRESVAEAAAWKELAPWLLVAAPVSIALGVAAAATHKGGVVAHLCLALPLAWSMPEIAMYFREGWPQILLVALPTVVLALTPLLVVGPQKVSVVQFLVAVGLLGAAGVAFLPTARNLVHS